MIPEVQIVTTQDVRFFMMDRTASENFLLDSVEFSDEEIHSGMQLTVDKYNSTLPMVDVYTVENFPYRYEMMLGTAASLLRSKSINYSRNRLDFSTKDGTTIQDKQKTGEYISIANAMMQEFDQRVTQIKKTKNAEQAFGFISGPYSYLRPF
jgi:hypothetical protein